MPITIGCHVELNLVDREGKKEQMSIDIVPDETADFTQGFIGAGTPLARNLIGEKAGVVIPYLRDDIQAIEILSVSPSKVKPEDDIQEKRKTQMAQAIREVEHTAAVVFASSFSGKWGDYDPESLPKDDEHTDSKKGG